MYFKHKHGVLSIEKGCVVKSFLSWFCCCLFLLIIPKWCWDGDQTNISIPPDLMPLLSSFPMSDPFGKIFCCQPNYSRDLKRKKVNLDLSCSQSLVLLVVPGQPCGIHTCYSSSFCRWMLPPSLTCSVHSTPLHSQVSRSVPSSSWCYTQLYILKSQPGQHCWPLCKNTFCRCKVVSLGNCQIKSRIVFKEKFLIPTQLKSPESIYCNHVPFEKCCFFVCLFLLNMTWKWFSPFPHGHISIVLFWSLLQW